MPFTVGGYPAATDWTPDPHRVWVKIALSGDRAVQILTLDKYGPLWTLFIQDYDTHVEPINTVECFDPRPIGGTQVWSMHAGCVAIDINSATWKQHLDLMPAALKKRIAELYARYPILVWGGSWSAAFLDQMHHQLLQDRVVSDAEVATQVAQGRQFPDLSPVPSDPEDLMYLVTGFNRQTYLVDPLGVTHLDDTSGFEGCPHYTVKTQADWDRFKATHKIT